MYATTAKVANIIEDARIAGPQLRIVEVGRRLAAYGISTTVIHPRLEAEQLRARLQTGNIGSLPIAMTRAHSGWKNLIRYAITFIPDTLRMHAALRRGNFDVVHCSGGAWQVKGLIAGRLAGLPVIWHLNDTSMPRLVRMLFHLVARWGASGFIVAGQRVRQYYRLERFPHKPVTEIQAPVDTAAFDPAIVLPDAEIEALPGLKIVQVANVNPLKGLHRFLEAASLLHERFKNLTFVVVGPTYQSQLRYRDALLSSARRNGIAEIVRFVGPKENVAAALAAADIVVCSSLFEASPMAVWEAMSMARPIVSTDVGDVARFISNGQSGVVVAPDCAASLAGGIARLLEDPRLRGSCGALARATAMESLDISVCVRLHAECYRAIGHRQ